MATFRTVPFTPRDSKDWQPVWEPTEIKTERAIPFSEPPAFAVQTAAGRPRMRVAVEITSDDYETLKKVSGSYGTLVDDRGGRQENVRLIGISGANVGNPCTCTLEFEGPHPGL